MILIKKKLKKIVKGHIKKEIKNNMPLTSIGKSVLRKMCEQYGEKKGKEVFYSSINSKKKSSEKWHKKRKETSSSRFSHRALSSALSKT